MTNQKKKDMNRIKRSNKLSSLIILVFLLMTTLIKAQITQNIKGNVIDKQSDFPLSGAEIVVKIKGKIYGAVSDFDGNYIIKEVPLGKINIIALYNGFESQAFIELSLKVGKELIVNFRLLEKIGNLEEIVLTGKSKRDNVAFVTGSSYGFNVAQTDKYAGSLADVSRMAMNYAGVNAADDSRNDIIVRGNNPTSLQWTMEGIVIPNPNHYSSSGSSGGPVSMININTLKKSDFLSSAFPANFGNTSAAVFDLQFREGNKDKYEFVGQIGFAGIEAGIEGPFSKKSDASFMVNYRYSTVALFSELGLDVGTGVAVPIYQDASVVVNVPTKKAGKIKIWAIAGVSDIEFDTTKEGAVNLYTDRDNSILTQNNKNIISGVSHKYFFNKKTSSNLSVSHSFIDQTVNIDLLNSSNGQFEKDFREELGTSFTTIQGKVKSKINVKNTIEIGTSFTNYGLDFDINFVGEYQSDIKDNAGLIGAYVNWQHRFSDRLILNAGIRNQYFNLNKQNVVEPRLGLKYKINEKSSINFGYGLHSNIHPLLTYFTKQEVALGNYKYENKDLGFTKSHHLVAGYQTQIVEKLNLKTEVYYQVLFDVPISHKDETYSIINSGYFDAGGAQILYDALYNEGKGKNYGLDVTIEKTLSNGFYMLLTGSLYESKYLAKDNIWRNTAWNGKFMTSFLTGKEFKINAKNSIGIDVNINYAGGRRFTAIDKVQSALDSETVFDTAQSFELQLPHYFRTDLKLSYKRNGKKISHEMQLDLRNLFNTQNIFSRKYNTTTSKIEDTFQNGILPVMQYRILF